MKHSTKTKLNALRKLYEQPTGKEEKIKQMLGPKQVYVDQAKTIFRLYEETIDDADRAVIANNLAWFIQRSVELEGANAEIERLRSKFDELDAWVGKIQEIYSKPKDQHANNH